MTPLRKRMLALSVFASFAAVGRLWMPTPVVV
jgi:hypothetical protein